LAAFTECRFGRGGHAVTKIAKTANVEKRSVSFSGACSA
jgi:hypothetical protein